MIHVKTYYDLVNQIRAERKCGGGGGGGGGRKEWERTSQFLDLLLLLFIAFI